MKTILFIFAVLLMPNFLSAQEVYDVITDAHNKANLGQGYTGLSSSLIRDGGHSKTFIVEHDGEVSEDIVVFYTVNNHKVTDVKVKLKGKSKFEITTTVNSISHTVTISWTLNDAFGKWYIPVNAKDGAYIQGFDIFSDLEEKE